MYCDTCRNVGFGNPLDGASRPGLREHEFQDQRPQGRWHPKQASWRGRSADGRPSRNVFSETISIREWSGRCSRSTTASLRRGRLLTTKPTICRKVVGRVSQVHLVQYFDNHSPQAGTWLEPIISSSVPASEQPCWVSRLSPLGLWRQCWAAGRSCGRVLLAVALGTLAAGNLLGGGAQRTWAAVRNDCLVPGCLFGILGTSLAILPMRHALVCQLLVVDRHLRSRICNSGGPVGCSRHRSRPTLMQGENKRTGRWAGLVLAAGSGGGIIGSLVAGIVCLPALGLARSYLAIAGLLALAGIPAIWPQRRWLAGVVLLILLVVVAVCWHGHKPEAIVQSCYGQLEVCDTPTARILLIDGLPQTGLPSNVMPGDGLRHGYLLEMALALLPKPTNALVIGLGAGLAPRVLAARGIDSLSVEADPQGS